MAAAKEAGAEKADQAGWVAEAMEKAMAEAMERAVAVVDLPEATVVAR